MCIAHAEPGLLLHCCIAHAWVVSNIHLPPLHQHQRCTVVGWPVVAWVEGGQDRWLPQSRRPVLKVARAVTARILHLVTKLGDQDKSDVTPAPPQSYISQVVYHNF